MYYRLPMPLTVDEFTEKHHPLYGEDPWIGYFEVCIDQYGNIYECVPCHQEFAFSYMCNRFGIEREELFEKLPIYISPIHYAAERFKLLFMWYEFGIGYEGYEDNDSYKALCKLRNLGFFSEIPKIDKSLEYSIVKSRGEDLL